MEEALAVNKMLVAIFSTIIGWGGFIVIVAMLRSFIITAVTSAAIILMARNKDTDFARLVVRNLVNENISPEELYERLNEEFGERRDMQKK